MQPQAYRHVRTVRVIDITAQLEVKRLRRKVRWFRIQRTAFVAGVAVSAVTYIVERWV